MMLISSALPKTAQTQNFLGIVGSGKFLKRPKSIERLLGYGTF